MGGERWGFLTERWAAGDIITNDQVGMNTAPGFRVYRGQLRSHFRRPKMISIVIFRSILLLFLLKADVHRPVQWGNLVNVINHRHARIPAVFHIYLKWFPSHLFCWGLESASSHFWNTLPSFTWTLDRTYHFDLHCIFILLVIIGNCQFNFHLISGFINTWSIKYGFPSSGEYFRKHCQIEKKLCN